MKKFIPLLFLLVLVLTGCTVTPEEPEVHFAEGYSVYYNAENKMETEIAEYLYAKLSSVCTDITLSSDAAEPADKCILIGSLCNDAFRTDLKVGHGAVTTQGTQINLLGFTDQMTCYAVDDFIKTNVLTNTAPSDGTRDVGTPIETTYKEYTVVTDISAADPWVIRHGDVYYYCWSGETCIYVKQLSNLDEATQNGGTVIWTAPADTLYSHEIWAPELHYLDGEWYIYFAADDGSDANHRMYILKGTSQNPTEPFEFVGKLEMQKDMWAIDGTVMQYKDELYFIWSANLAGEQRIAIAHMSDPVTIDTKHTTICSATLDWERKTQALCEGPVALTNGDNAVVVYSASAGWTSLYSLGALTLTGEDVLDKTAWIKRDTPLLTRSDKTYCTGHCSFVEEFDGTTWIVYHARHKRIVGWEGRELRIQPVFWNGEILIVGDPAEVGETLYLPQK